MPARRFTLVAVVGIAGSGCATSFELKNPLPKQQANQARLASHAATGEYPPQAATQTVAVTAVVDRDGKSLRVINPTDTAYHGVRVWLNQQHVAWLNELPPRRVVVIPQESFADAGRSALSLTNDNVKLAEMQTNGQFYRLLGPAMEPSERDRPRGRGFELAFPPPPAAK